jgi:alcohol dehydrogenase class IV
MRHDAQPMNRFEFATAQRIIFGRGTVRELPALAAEFGQRALLITGSRPQQWETRLPYVGFKSIRGEPTTQDIQSGLELAKQLNADVIIAIGGGSVVDAGKAIAAMSTQPCDLMRYIEIIGEGKPLEALPLPFIAVPTTAGTGAEATRNAVIASAEHRVKASLRHLSMLPRIALIDPELAVDLSPHVTAASGMDALTQCLEAFVCSRAQPMTDALCLDGIHSDPKNFSHSGVGSRDILLWFRDGHGSPTAKVNFAHRYAVHRQRRRAANDEQQLQAPSHFTEILI